MSDELDDKSFKFCLTVSCKHQGFDFQFPVILCRTEKEAEERFEELKRAHVNYSEFKKRIVPTANIRW